MHPLEKMRECALLKTLLSEHINISSLSACANRYKSIWILFKWQYKEIQADNLGSSGSIQHFQSFKRPINKF